MPDFTRIFDRRKIKRNFSAAKCPLLSVSFRYTLHKARNPRTEMWTLVRFKRGLRFFNPGRDKLPTSHTFPARVFHALEKHLKWG